MLVLIAKPPLHVIPFDVLNGLSKQSEHLDLVCYGINPFKHPIREVCINASRRKLQDLVRSMNLSANEIVILLDNDVVLDDPLSIETLKTNVSSGYPKAIKTKESRNHVLAACCGITVEDYLAIDYITSPSICQCSLIAIRYDLKYIDGVLAHENKII